MTAEDAPILDDDVLGELRDSTGGDEAFVRELVEAYVGEATGYLDAMIAAATAGDAEAMVRPAHTMKSSSATMGAMRLAGICRALEEAARAGRTDGQAVLVEEAHAAWRETLSALASAGLTA